MKTLHNTRNCNYRRFLHSKLKHGKISGRLYKFICRTHPYRLTTYNITFVVRKILDGKITENKGIQLLQQDAQELKRQQEMYKSNIECRNKISEKKTAKKFTTEQDVGRDIARRRTTPYTKPLLSRESPYDKHIAKANKREKQEYLEFIKNKFKANKISRKVLDHAVLFIKKCMKENLYLPMRFKTSVYRILDCNKHELSGYEKDFFDYFRNALSKTHKYSLYKQKNK